MITNTEVGTDTQAYYYIGHTLVAYISVQTDYNQAYLEKYKAITSIFLQQWNNIIWAQKL